MEKRCSFELFKSNVCHWLKEEGDIDFLIQVLESDLILKYYNRKWYLESFYLLGMFDYNVSAQKTLSVRKNVRGMNAPIVYKPDIIPTDFFSGILNLFWPDVLPSAEIQCTALLFQEKRFQ